MPSSRHFLAYVAAAAALGASSPAGAQTTASSAFALQSAGVEITRNAQTGLVNWMSGSAEQPVARPNGLTGTASFEAAAAAFLGSQATAFGLRNASAELAPTRTVTDNIERTYVRFQQSHQSVPILGAELNVQLDKSRNVISVNGKTVGDLNLSVQPAVSAADALTTAINTTARVHNIPAADLSGTQPSLAIHDARIMGGPSASPALVWRVDVRSSTRLDIFELVLVDAQNGRVAVQFNQVENADAPPRRAKQWVCDAANTTGKYPCTKADAIANPGASPLTDVQDAFRFAQDTYAFYALRFGRNSLNDNGLRLVSTVRYRDPSDPGEDLQNAFWSSDTNQMAYGKDYATGLDVVGHELTHGFTNFSSHLFYYYQSGAVDESISDTFGELIQRSIMGEEGWLMGEDLPIGAIRNMSNPPQFNQPDKMTSTLWTADSSFRDRGGVHTNSGVGNKAAFLITAGGTFNNQTVVGLGIDKAAAIYYQVNGFILQSASDYADLGNALNQACKNLIGTVPNARNGQPSRSGAITARNCANVAKAVLATEMAKQPQYWPIPAEAQVCNARQTAKDIRLENFEARNASRFTYQPSDGHWFLSNTYAASNMQAVGAGGDGQFDTNLASTKPVGIPARAFLRFAHYYNLYTDNTGSYAGGIVEYSLGNNVWQTFAPAAFTDNPYNVTLKTGTGNVLAGKKAFSGFSGGWTSSRIDLSSLRGKKVSFRFRMATDPHGAWDSWILDDIRLYTCQPSAPGVASAE